MVRQMMPRQTVFCLIATVISTVFGAGAWSNTVVSPPGLADTEGNRLANPTTTYPVNPCCGSATPDGFRTQELYLATDFSSTAAGPLVITGLAWRPDASVDEPVSVQLEYDIWLGTTRINTLRATRRENYGDEDPTLVMSGPVSLATDGVARPGGLPHDFDYALEFDTPYVYDPADGNLLVEMASPLDHLDAPIWRDFHTTSGAQTRFRFFANHIDPDVAVGHATGVSVTQFTIAPSLAPVLQPGDANQDLTFDQFDLVQVQVAAKYLSGQPATWGEGDWNGGPGGQQGSPPAGNGRFDQLDIMAALSAGKFLTGPYAAIQTGGTPDDGQTSVIYNAGTGELSVDPPAGTQLTSINVDSASGIFTGDAARNLGGSFDHDADNNIFKATFGGSFGSLSFGNVARAGLSEQLVANDLTVVGSLAGGGDLGAVDLVYIPEPTTVVLLALGLVAFMAMAGRGRQMF